MRREDSAWWREGFTQDWWLGLSPDARELFLGTLSDEEVDDWASDWRVWARDDQLPPDGNWRTWLLVCGRGWGKTRTAVEFIQEEVNKGLVKRIAIVGQGLDDIRTVMIEGDSGFLATAGPGNRPKFYPSVGGGRLVWPNRATAFVYSAEDTEGLRGPQFHLGWFDEPMAVPADKRERAFNNLLFCLRLRVPGSRPRLIISTTPKPHVWMQQQLREAEDHPDRVHLTNGSTFDNEANLDPDFLEAVRDKFEGTRLGDQELHGVMKAGVEGAIWTEAILDKQRMRCPETDDGSWPTQLRQAFANSCDKVVVGVDPNLKAGSKTAHAAGVVVAAAKGKNRYVLEDFSTKGGPLAWGKAAVRAFERYDANEIVVETNQGGDMCEIVLRQAADELGIDIKVVNRHAYKGKTRRAEPIGAAYERGRVFHLAETHGSKKRPGPLFALEEQMTNLHEGLDPTGEDFDRADALVWALTRLKVGKSSSARASASAPGGGFRSFGGMNHGDAGRD